MHPSKYGDTYEMAKICMLRWLERFEPWGIHPMYFPKRGEPRDEAFPCNYADFLGITCVGGDIRTPDRLAEAVHNWQGTLFLDPDTGLWRDKGTDRTHVGMPDLITIAQANNRKNRLTLVYDQSIDRNDPNHRSRRDQIRAKLTTLKDAGIHSAAYVSHIAFIWLSCNPDVVTQATRNVLRESRLPTCCFVDDPCGHLEAD